MLRANSKDFLLKTSASHGLLFDTLSMCGFIEHQKKITPQWTFLFPVKALPVTTALKSLGTTCHGFEVSNLREFSLLTTVLHPGHKISLNNFPPADVSSLPPVVTPERIWFNAASLKELKEGINLKRRFGIHLGIRLNASVFGVEFSRFGISEDDLRTLPSPDRNIIDSFHVHWGMGKGERELFSYIRKLDEISSDFPSVKQFNMGGGWSLESFSEELVKRPLTFENGRSVTGPFGYAFTRIENLRWSSGRLIIESPLSPLAHLRWPSSEISCSIIPLASDRQTTGVDSLNLVGPTCFENDLLTLRLEKNIRIGIGDLLVIHPVSGYSVALNHSFNGIPAAKVFFTHES